MKKVVKFFSKAPTAVNSKSHSAVQTTSEYTESAEDKTPAVAQQSETVPGIAELAAKVDALTAVVEKIVVNQGAAATMPDTVSETAAVAQNSTTVEGAKEATEAVNNLSPEADKVVAQPMGAVKEDEKVATDAVAQSSEGPKESSDDKPEDIPESNLGAEVPSNNGLYTDVPEEDIVKQFSKSANMTVEEASILPLTGQESFGCLFK